jgi:hypothetical protein
MPLLTAKSVKGAFPIRWEDLDARAHVLHTLATAALSLVRLVHRHLSGIAPPHRAPLQRIARHLQQVLRQDLDRRDDGHFILSTRTTNRLISLGDPQARRFYKSESQPFDGFKTHALGDPASHFIAAVAVSAGNVADGALARPLLRRAKALVPFLKEVMGDAAYGEAQLRQEVREAWGITLVSPPRKGRPPRDPNQYVKADFALDFENRTGVCPEGVSSARWEESARGAQTVHWPASACGVCPAQSRCQAPKRSGKRVELHAYEEELRSIRAQWKNPATRRAYRNRSPGEGLMRALTRHGARQARAWGLRAVECQAYLIATVSNLKQLAQFWHQHPPDIQRQAA